MASLRLPALLLIVAACATAGSSQNQQNDGPPADDAPQAIDGNNCAMQPCDILAQCGCATGTACDIDGMDLDGSACRTVAATAQAEGGSCANTSGCQGGTVCLGSPGVCKKYCDENSDCGQPRGQCLIEITDGTNPIPNIPKTCSANCDPVNVAAGGCPSGMKCGFFTTGAPTNIDFVDCDGAGTLVQGGNCEIGTTNTGNDALCGPDFLCTTLNNTDFNCRHICNRTANTGCVGAQTCIAFNPVLMVSGTEYGVCN
jgi:hypothetical protein